MAASVWQRLDAVLLQAVLTPDTEKLWPAHTASDPVWRNSIIFEGHGCYTDQSAGFSKGRFVAPVLFPSGHPISEPEMRPNSTG
jgi:hypothetical protein